VKWSKKSGDIVKCPFCQYTDNKVLDSRLTPDSDSIRRRRECMQCSKRFTTYERIELFDISVVKRDGRREPFSREKVLKGIMRACEKRPVKREQMEAIVAIVESSLRQSDRDEIKSSKIGELIMNELAKLDEVAYVRFASVYKKFRDANQFVDAIKTLKKQERIVEITPKRRVVEEVEP
jgi:transcriptional repressor NrdR